MPPPRRYEQTARAEAAEETRRRILDALYDRLREAPPGPVSVEEVARRAGVARSTVYIVFGSRSGLFDAFTDRLLQGAGFDRIIEAVRHPDPRESLRGGVEGSVRLYAANHEVFRILKAMATLDPEGVGRAIDAAEARRAAGMEALAARLDEAGLLPPGMTRAQAADIFWVMVSFDAFDLLATGRGLGPDEIIATLTRTAEAALLGV